MMNYFIQVNHVIRELVSTSSAVPEPRVDSHFGQPILPSTAWTQPLFGMNQPTTSSSSPSGLSTNLLCSHVMKVDLSDLMEPQYSAAFRWTKCIPESKALDRSSFIYHAPNTINPGYPAHSQPPPYSYVPESIYFGSAMPTRLFSSIDRRLQLCLSKYLGIHLPHLMFKNQQSLLKSREFSKPNSFFYDPFQPMAPFVKNALDIPFSACSCSFTCPRYNGSSAPLFRVELHIGDGSISKPIDSIVLPCLPISFTALLRTFFARQSWQTLEFSEGCILTLDIEETRIHLNPRVPTTTDRTTSSVRQMRWSNPPLLAPEPSRLPKVSFNSASPVSFKPSTKAIFDSLSKSDPVDEDETEALPEIQVDSYPDRNNLLSILADELEAAFRSKDRLSRSPVQAPKKPSSKSKKRLFSRHRHSPHLFSSSRPSHHPILVPRSPRTLEMARAHPPIVPGDDNEWNLI